MKTLWLLRHAKAITGEGMPDRERSLSARGREAAERMGRCLAERGARPDLVLCSPSVRTRETLELAAKALGTSLSVEFEEELYLASADDLLERIELVPDDAASVLLVGHNPGIEELGLELAGRGDSGGIERMRHKFPTGALAEFRVHAEEWRRFARKCELIAFVTPKTLSSER